MYQHEVYRERQHFERLLRDAPLHLHLAPFIVIHYGLQVIHDGLLVSGAGR